MNTIEEEIKHLITFLSHPAGFDVDTHGSLCIRPISEDSPPTHWAVDWEDTIDGITVTEEKCFPDDLPGAVRFFVEKRRYLCLGSDFNTIYAEQEKEDSHV